MGRKQAAIGAHQSQRAMLHVKEAAERMATLAPRQEQIAALTAALGALRITEPETSAEIVTARQALKDAIAALERSARAREGTEGLALQAEKAAERARLMSQELSTIDQKMMAETQAMAERQALMGREQAELGRAQRTAAEAARERIRKILEEARARGLAESVK